MSINIAEWNLPGKGSIRIEISDNAEFLQRVKEINREVHKRRPTKVRVLGNDRTPADIQRLVDGTDESQEEVAEVKPEPTKEQLDELGSALADLQAVQQEHGLDDGKIPGRPVRRQARRGRAGGPLKG